MASLKQDLKQILIDRQHRRYQREAAAKNLTYDQWITEQEETIRIEQLIWAKNNKNLTNDMKRVVFGSCENKNEGNHSKNVDFCKTLEETKQKYILFSLYEGEISEFACGLILENFEKDKNIILIYGDEDTQEGAVRKNPWMKPDWSPDRFLSCFYFGGLVAVRTKALQKAYIHYKERANEGKDFCQFEEIGLLYNLLFEMLKENGAFAKHDDVQRPVCHIPQILFHSRGNGYEQIKNFRLPEICLKEFESLAGNPTVEVTQQQGSNQKTEKDMPIVSIIIPSKDNPQVLFHCIDSLTERTKTNLSYELILVDNGSSEDNRRQIAEKVDALNRDAAMGCTYLYQPMPFNFSKMCNMGAEASKGELLLFLNDDMEIIQSDWMELLAEKACLPYAGAVGAKLLYPDTDIIQHAGITNLRVGPAHKLQFLHDEEDHYFGMNRGVHDMLAVTGACLMVRKSVFQEAGGFFEGLAVAFNDVDLCYTIYERGYYNIERNDVHLYHHESLSRGKDGESEEKQLRLLREKDILYERHQELYGKDPFYNPNLTTDRLETTYSPAYQYQVTLDMPWAEVKEITAKIGKAREDECLVVGMEAAMDLYKWRYGVSPEKGKIKAKESEMGFYFQGYSFIIGADNACYKKRLLLKNRENMRVWSIPVEVRRREDIKNNLEDQLNVDLTGYAAKMRREDIPEGVYRFGMLAEDQCSRQKLVNWSNWVLEIKHH